MFAVQFLWVRRRLVSPAGVLGHLYFGLSLSDSIEHRRVHHQLEPDTVYVEGTRLHAQLVQAALLIASCPPAVLTHRQYYTITKDPP